MINVSDAFKEKLESGGILYEEVEATYASPITVTSRVATIQIASEGIKITSQPESYVGAAGDSVTFTVEAEGEGLSYQWQFSDDGGSNWRNSSITESTYATTLTEDRDGRIVRCIVTDESGNSVTTVAVTMSIESEETPVIVTQPENATVAIGGVVTYTVEAEGTESYAWYYSADSGTSWEILSTWEGYDTDSISYTFEYYRFDYLFHCVITGADGSILITNDVWAEQEGHPRITVQPEDFTGEIGDAVSLTVEVEGDGVSYQWQLSDDTGTTWNNSTASTAATATYQTTLTEARSGRMLRCIITIQGDIFDTEILEGENDLVDGAESSSFSIGVAIEKYMTLQIDNRQDQYADVDFYGAVLKPYLKLQLDDGTTEKIKKGTYTITSPETYGDTIALTAFDDMYKADTTYSTNLSFPQTLFLLVEDACNTCGISMGFSSMEHGDLVLESIPDGLTFRAFLGYAAMVEGANARIDCDGYLQFIAWDFSAIEDDGDYHELRDFVNSPTLSSDDVVLTGITVKNSSDSYQYGESGYILELSNLILADDDLETVATWIGEQYVGATFRTMSGDMHTNPLIEFGDMALSYKYIASTKEEKSYVTPITDVSFILHGYTTVKTRATDPVRGSSTYNAAISQALIAAKVLLTQEQTAREQAISDLADALSTASGVYITEEEQEDGSVVIYLHDKVTLLESQNIIKITSDAIGFSIDGGETYPYGFTLNGETITRLLYAEGINADYIKTGTILVTDDDGNTIFSANIDTGEVVIDSSLFVTGKTLADSTTYYATTTSTNDAPDDDADWSEECPSAEDGVYIWVKTVYTYSDGSTKETTAIRMSGYDGTDGSDGADGTDGSSVSISSTAIDYQASDSGTETPTGDWTEDIPEISQGQYLWTRTTVEYVLTASDGTTSNESTVSYCVAYIGVDGEDGEDGADGCGVSTTAVTYQASTSGTTTPTGSWSSSIPDVDEGCYLWTRTVFTYTDGTTATMYSVAYNGTNGEDGTDGTDGANGSDGTGIVSITNYYLATSASSGVDTSTSGWTESVQSVTSTNKYLWNYEVVTLTDGNTDITTPCIIGVCGTDGADGEDGVGISSVTEYYAVSTSNSTAPTTWSTSLQTMDSTNKYLWNYEVITYTDASTQSTSKRVIGVYGDTGDTGAAGADGVDGADGSSVTISSTSITYQASSSGTTTPSGTWSTSVPSVSNGQYLWTKTVVTYLLTASDGTTSTQSTTSYSVAYIGTDGEDGADGSDGSSFNWNLLTGTKDCSGLSNQSYITTDTYNDFTVVYYNNNNSSSGYVDICQFASAITPEADTYYTASFYAKGSGQIATFFYPNTVASGYSSTGATTTGSDGVLYTTLTDEWTRYWFTWKTSSDVSGAKNVLFARAFYGVECYICGMKLEEGTTASAWAPAESEIYGEDGADGEDGQMLYATCSTAAGTAAKVATLASGSLTLKTGSTVAVTFTYANTAASPTLNVGGTGAKAIYVYGSALTSSSIYNWVAGATVQFVYDGTRWVMSDTSALYMVGQWCYANNTIYMNGEMLAAGTVTAAKLYVTELSAITADLGDITAGTLKSSNYVEGESGVYIDLTNGTAQFSGDVYAISFSLDSAVMTTGDGSFSGTFYDISGSTSTYSFSITNGFKISTDNGLIVEGNSIFAKTYTATAYTNYLYATYITATTIFANTTQGNTLVAGMLSLNYGAVRVYSPSGAYYWYISGNKTSSANYTLYLPLSGGCLVCATNGSAVGGTATPVYISSSGVATACSATVGSATQLMYLSSGTLTASSSTVGSSTSPVYLSSGVITECGSVAATSVYSTLSTTSTATWYPDMHTTASSANKELVHTANLVAYQSYSTSTSGSGYFRLTFGNSTAYTSSGSSYGVIRIYGYGAYYWDISGGNTTTISASRTLYLPNVTATGCLIGMSQTTALGGAAKPIYVAANGVATACSSTVGGTATPVYMSSGTITQCSSTIGGTATPVYMSGGAITKCSSTVGQSVVPVYMSSGAITACTVTASGSPWTAIPYIDGLGVEMTGKYLDFYVTSTATSYGVRLTAASSSLTCSGSFSYGSDERLKNIISTIDADERYRTLFNSLTGFSFTWNNADESQVHLGVGAQTTKLAMVDAGFGEDELFLVQYDAEADFYSVAYNELQILTMAVVQDHEKSIEELQEEVADLKSQLAQLQASA